MTDSTLEDCPVCHPGPAVRVVSVWIHPGGFIRLSPGGKNLKIKNACPLIGVEP